MLVVPDFALQAQEISGEAITATGMIGAVSAIQFTVQSDLDSTEKQAACYLVDCSSRITPQLSRDADLFGRPVGKRHLQDHRHDNPALIFKRQEVHIAIKIKRGPLEGF